MECESNICESAWYRRPQKFSISRDRDNEGPQGLSQDCDASRLGPQKIRSSQHLSSHGSQFPVLGAVEYRGAWQLKQS